MGALSPTHWLIIVGVLVLLFGAKRLPDFARGLGRSARILKAEVHELKDTAAETAHALTEPTAPEPTAPPAAEQAPAARTDRAGAA